MKQKLTFKKFYDEYGVLLILLVMVAIFSFATPTFLTGANIINISKQVAIMAILSVGMTLVLVSGGGGIELSMGSVISLVVVLISKFVTERGFSVAIALILAVLVATALGFIDGVIIAKIKVPPLIMTLGMQIFLYGFTYSICEGKPVYGIPASLTWIGQTYLFKVIPQKFCCIQWCTFPCCKDRRFSFECCTKLLVLSDITIVQFKKNR